MVLLLDWLNHLRGKDLKQKIRYIIFASLLGLFIGFLYNHIVIPNSYRKGLFLYKDTIKLRNSQYINKTYIIPYKETCFLKIISSPFTHKTIRVNNRYWMLFKKIIRNNKIGIRRSLFI